MYCSLKFAWAVEKLGFNESHTVLSWETAYPSSKATLQFGSVTSNATTSLRSIAAVICWSKFLPET